MHDNSKETQAKFKLGDVSYVPHNKIMYECVIISIKKHYSGKVIYGSKSEGVPRAFYRDDRGTLTKEESDIVKKSWDCLI